MVWLTGKYRCLCGMNVPHPRVHWQFPAHWSIHRELSLHVYRALWGCHHQAVLKAPTNRNGTLPKRARFGSKCRPKHFHKKREMKTHPNKLDADSFSHNFPDSRRGPSTWGFTHIPCGKHGKCRILWGVLASVCSYCCLTSNILQSLQHCCAHMASLGDDFLGLCLIIACFCPLSQGMYASILPVVA